MKQAIERLVAVKKDYEKAVIGFRNGRPPLFLESTVNPKQNAEGIIVLSQETANPAPRNQAESMIPYLLEIYIDPSEIGTIEFYNRKRIDTTGTGILQMAPVRE
jgi:hypothetical protein